MIFFQSKESQESSPTPQFKSINSPVPTTRVKKWTQEMKGLSPPVPRAVGHLGQRETGPGISGKLTTLGLFFIYLFIFFLAVLGLRCCLGLSLVVASECYILVVLPRLLTAVASFVGAHGLQSLRTSVTVASRAQA